jgi:tetratricopeptide (TPR) repeat protein
LDTHIADLQLGMARQAENNLVEAETCYRRVLAQNPKDPDALNLLATICLASNRAAEALALQECCLQLRPDVAVFWNNLSLICRNMGDMPRALDASNKAIELDPTNAGFWNNLGIAHKHLRQFDEAVSAYEHALKINPAHTEAENNLGVVHAMQLRYQEAIPHYRRALSLAPKKYEFHFNEGIARLTLGDYLLGFLKYEFRWNTLVAMRPFTQPIWRGDFPLKGKRVLLHAEQGFGDTIQFCRYAPLVAALGATVILEVQPALAELCAESFPDIHVVKLGETLPDFDAHCPLLSLPHAFRTELCTIPATIPYLRVTASSISHWKKQLGLRQKTRVAFVWAGSGSNQEDGFRSLVVEDLLPFMRHPGIQAVSLQKDRSENDARLLASVPGLLDAAPLLRTFTDTAAILHEADLVIAVDTSVAHLAAAIGSPTWILNRFNTDWRWLLDRSDSPWYPGTARLFRQKTFGDWTKPLDEMKTAFDSFLAEKNTASSPA